MLSHFVSSFPTAATADHTPSTQCAATPAGHTSFLFHVVNNGCIWRACTVADPGEPWGPGPPCPQDFFNFMQFSGNFWGKNPYFEQILGSGPLLGVQTPLGPLTKVLDPRLLHLSDLQLYRWVPVNRNMDNPNSRLIMANEVSDLSRVNSPLNLKFAKKTTRCINFELSGTSLYLAFRCVSYILTTHRVLFKSCIFQQKCSQKGEIFGVKIWRQGHFQPSQTWGFPCSPGLLIPSNRPCMWRSFQIVTGNMLKKQTFLSSYQSCHHTYLDSKKNAKEG